MIDPALSSTAILVIDPQPTFMPGGELAVVEGDAIVEPGRAFLERWKDLPAIVTQDWHPPGHVSFASSHASRAAFSTIELYGHPQTLWPDHAIQGAFTAAVHPGLPLDRFCLILRKGTSPTTDSYSAFRENISPDGHRPPTGLAGYCRDRGITDLWIWGLALDYCVAWSARDASDAGFRVTVVEDLTRPVDPMARGPVLESFRAAGIHVVRSEDLG